MLHGTPTRDRTRRGGLALVAALGLAAATPAGAFSLTHERPSRLELAASTLRSVGQAASVAVPSGAPAPVLNILPIPEPGTWLLLSLGLGGLVTAGRRRRARSLPPA